MAADFYIAADLRSPLEVMKLQMSAIHIISLEIEFERIWMIEF